MTETVDPATLDPATTYRVELERPCRVDGIPFGVRGLITMRGDFLARLIAQEGADAVRSAQPE